MSNGYTPRTFLHHLLDKQRMTQKYFAELMGVDRPNVSMWMSGKRMPYEESINKMADILQVDRKWLHGNLIGMQLVRAHGSEDNILLNYVKEHIENEVTGQWYAKHVGGKDAE
jgi:transcriptional regulator with XRE-family HTH domain